MEEMRKQGGRSKTEEKPVRERRKEGRGKMRRQVIVNEDEVGREGNGR